MADRARVLFQQIIWILQKELRYATRDTDVLIYSVLMPLLVYPLLIVAGCEVVFWKTSQKEEHHVRCALMKFDGLPEYLLKTVLNDKDLRVVKSSDPMDELNQGKIDLVLEAAEHSENYEISAFIGSKKKFNLELGSLRNKLRQAQLDAQAEALKNRGVPSSLLHVFELRTLHLVPGKNGKAIEERMFPIVALGIAMIAVLQSAAASGTAAVCVLSGEREKNTFETTATLPVHLELIVIAKWLACALIATVSAAMYIFAGSISTFGMLLQAKSMYKKEISDLVDPTLFDLSSIGWATVGVVGCTALTSALCMAVIARCQNARDGQQMASYPVMLITFLPLMALIPGIESHSWILAIPILNTIVALKHSHNEFSQVIALAVNLLCTAVALFVSTRLYFDEKNLLSGSGNSRLSAQEETL